MTSIVLQYYSEYSLGDFKKKMDDRFTNAYQFFSDTSISR